MKNKTLFVSLAVSGLFLFAFFTFYFFSQELKRHKLPVVSQLGDFQLIDENGAPFGFEQLRGRVWIANFFFTTCGDICPMLSKNMRQLSETFKRLPNVQLVSFSVNPEYDHPAVLKEYAKQFVANPNWHFLTGEREELTRVVIEGFKLGDIKEPIFHSAYFALVDRHGYIRGYYEGTDQSRVNQLFKDVAQLLKDH